MSAEVLLGALCCILSLCCLFFLRVAHHATERRRVAESELSELRINNAVMRGALGLIRCCLDAPTARKLAREALEETL